MVLQIPTYGNLLVITKPFFKGHACSQVLFVHCSSQQIYLLTLIFQTTFSSSFMCQSKLKCRTLQQQDIKRRQGTECTSREYFPYITNNSYQNFKIHKLPGALQGTPEGSILFIYYYCYYHYYFYYITHSSIILWCII